MSDKKIYPFSDKTHANLVGYFQLAGHLRKWYADHDPTSNEVTAGPEYGTVEVLDFYINIVTWQMWFCIDDTPGAQQWRKIVTEPYTPAN